MKRKTPQEIISDHMRSIGGIGGKSTSEKKAAAARINGKKNTGKLKAKTEAV